MADNVTLDPGAGGAVVSTEEVTTLNGGAVAAQHITRMLLAFRTSDGTGVDLPGDAANGLDVDVTRSALPTGASTSAKQPALGTAGSASADVITVQGIASGTVIPVSGTVTATGPLTDTQLRATAVPVSGTVTATGPLTDTQLRATAVPVSGTVTANLGTAAVTNAGTFAVQIAANSSINNAQVSGTAVSVNSGTKDPGTQRVILASDQTVVPISDNSGSLTVDAPVGTPAFVRLSDGSAAITTLAVSLASLPALAAGTNNVGFVVPTPGTTGGWSKAKYAAQTTTKQAVKASAGTFGGYYAYNPNSSVAYIQVFDVASGSVTLGTTAPDMIFAIPAASAANIEITCGVNMATAITLACTTTATGLTAPTTGLDLTIFYK